MSKGNWQVGLGKFRESSLYTDEKPKNILLDILVLITKLIDAFEYY